MKPAGDFLWRGPSFMSRMAGHEAPHVAPRDNETKMKKVRRVSKSLSVCCALSEAPRVDMTPNICVLHLHMHLLMGVMRG
jgi:hypothetical protein